MISAPCSKYKQSDEIKDNICIASSTRLLCIKYNYPHVVWANPDLDSIVYHPLASDQHSKSHLETVSLVSETIKDSITR